MVCIYIHVACLACDCNGCLKVSYPSSDTNNKKKRCFHIHPDGNHPNENNRNYIFVKCVVKLLEFEFMVYWLHMLILAVSIDICKKNYKNHNYNSNDTRWCLPVAFVGLLVKPTKTYPP